MFDKFNIVPRWVIFLLDLFGFALAATFGYFLIHDFDPSQFYSIEFSRILLITLAASAIVSYRIRMFAGIVRYTSALDSMRILAAVGLIMAILFLVNIILIAFNGMPLFSTTQLITFGLFSFLILMVYRTLVKMFFMYIKNVKGVRVRTIVYGAGDIGIAAKRTLDHDHKSNHAVVGFIDDNPKKIGKVIDGVRIYESGHLPALIHDTRANELIIASHNIPLAKKNEVVDICLESGVKVMTMPPVDRLINGELKPAQIKELRIEDLLERPTIDIRNRQVGDELANKRILVTGAAGSIGSEIARQLALLGPQLIILADQAETPLHELKLELAEQYGDKAYHAHICDIRDESRMRALFKNFNPHYVYHAAAYKHVPMMESHPVEAVRTNIMGTRLLAQLSVEFGVDKFVMVSTDKAVNPTNIMGASKRIAEIYVQTYFSHLTETRGVSDPAGITKFITTRFGNVLGSNGSVIPRFKAQIERGGPVTVTHPEITRFFMTIPEACQLVLEAGAMGKGGEIYVFDMGKSVKIVDLAHKMIKLSGMQPNKDIAIEFSGLRPGEKLYEELLNDLENTLPTHHDKIMVAQVREYDFHDVERKVERLIQLANKQNEREIVVFMKAMVPEFKSKNSVFEELDE